MRWFLATCVAYSALFVLCSTAIVVCLATFGWRKHSYFYLVCRGFGRIYLSLVGVRLIFQDGLPFQERRARIMTFNHSSQLDLFIMSSLMPPGGVPTMKKEMLYIPVLGQVLWLFGALMINRTKQSSAHASLDDGARRMKKERLSVGISPEGTRSEDGSLARFKKGTFHLAKATKVPVECLHIEHASTLQPLGQWYVFPGEIVVSSAGSLRTPSEDDTPELWTNELREIFLRAMSKSDGRHEKREEMNE